MAKIFTKTGNETVSRESSSKPDGEGALMIMRRVRELLRHSLLRDVLTLYTAHVARYLFPLIVVPYLARVLKPAGLGAVAIAQGLGGFLTLVVEYGFNFSATREIARARESRERIGDILAGVMGAKVGLSALCVLAGLLLQRWIPIFHDDSALLWAAIFAALAQSFSLWWLFQGLERMKVAAGLDVAAKIVITIGVFFLVKVPSDAWKVLALQGIGFGLAGVVGLILAYREIPFRLPALSRAWEALVMGWTMFLFRGAVSLYTVGNAFVLGLFAPPQFVGYYSASEKIFKAFGSLLEPVSQALYPRLSYLAHHARSKALQLARVGVFVMGTAGILIGIVMVVTAPLVVRILLGPGFGAAVPVLRILSLMPVLVFLSNIFGIQLMLPLGMDRAFNTIILAAGCLNLALAVLLAPRFAHLGMAWAVVLSETFVATAMYLGLRKKGIDLFMRPTETKTESSELPVPAKF